MRASFFDSIKQVDQLIQSGPVTPEAISSFLLLIENPEVERYFYKCVNDSTWLRPLEIAGVFSTAHFEEFAENRTGSKYSEVTAFEYLLRVAQDHPEAVTRILRDLEVRRNPVICREMFKIAKELPSNILQGFSSVLTCWLAKSERFTDYNTLSEIVKHLWKEGFEREALDLLITALEPVIDQVSIHHVRQNIECRTDDWAIKELLEIVIPVLAEKPSMAVLDRFSNLLFSVREGNIRKPKSIKILGAELPSIENHEQNQLYEDYPNLIVFAVRDFALGQITSNWNGVIECLRKYEDSVFIRIELFLRSKLPHRDPEGTSELLCREEILNDSAFHHERFHLLKACFGILSEAAKANYFRFVEDETRLAAIRERRSDVSDADWPRLKERLTYDRLIPIAEYLEGDWKRRFDGYLEEFGEDPHPDFLFYMEGGRLINRMPARPLEEFSNISAADFADHIRDLEATPETSMEAKSELANTLQDLVSARIAEFATAAHSFSDLPLMYTSSFLRSIRDYLATQRPLESEAWHSVLELCASEVQRYRAVTESRESDRDTYIHLRIIISILQSCLKRDEVRLPVEERESAWKVLYPLTDHPDPQADEEEIDEDMASSSINTVRGEAMHAVVDYAWWVRRTMGTDFQNMTTIPEVRELLEKHLIEDNALTICAVYGKWYPWLEALDSAWAKEWKSRIFPESDANRRRVAWETYITFCPPYNGVFETLKDDYTWAVTQIGTWPERQRSMGHPDESLLEHLFAYYWRERLSLDDPDVSLCAAYAKASEEHKVEALRFVGRNVKEWVEVAPETLDRLKTLWVDVVKPASGPKALETFGLWFSSGRFDDSWSLSELHHVLKHAKPVRPEHWVIERLGKLAPDYPGETLACLESMYGCVETPAYLEHWWEHVMAVLRAALSSQDQTTKTKAIELANIIGSKGLQSEHLDELRALVSKYQAADKPST